MAKEEIVAIQTLHGKCDVIKEILNKANGTAAKIMGGPGLDSTHELKEPAGTLESLATELILIQNIAENVLDYLIKMDEMI